MTTTAPPDERDDTIADLRAQLDAAREMAEGAAAAVPYQPGPPELWFSARTDAYAVAFAAMQGEFDTVPRTATGQVGQAQKPYADMAAVVATVSPAMKEHGFGVQQFPAMSKQGEVAVSTLLLHVSGQWSLCTLRMPSGNTPQQQGSAITYARRYSLMAVLGLAPDDDDDGAAASQGASQTQGRSTGSNRARRGRGSGQGDGGDAGGDAGSLSRVPPPGPAQDGFFAKLGYEGTNGAGRTLHDAELAAVRERARKLNAASRSKIKDWMAGHKPPFTAAFMTEYAAAVLSYEMSPEPEVDPEPPVAEPVMQSPDMDRWDERDEASPGSTGPDPSEEPF